MGTSCGAVYAVSNVGAFESTDVHSLVGYLYEAGTWALKVRAPHMYSCAT